MIDVQMIRDIFENDEDYIYDELRYVNVGQILHLDRAPKNFTFKVVDTNTDAEYDSYGNGYLNDGFVVFEVHDDYTDETEIFKIPGTYSSYEGDSWHINKISAVVKTQKVVTTWEWQSA